MLSSSHANGREVDVRRQVDPVAPGGRRASRRCLHRANTRHSPRGPRGGCPPAVGQPRPPGCAPGLRLGRETPRQSGSLARAPRIRPLASGPRPAASPPGSLRQTRPAARTAPGRRGAPCEGDLGVGPVAGFQTRSSGARSTARRGRGRSRRCRGVDAPGQRVGGAGIASRASPDCCPPRRSRAPARSTARLAVDARRRGRRPGRARGSRRSCRAASRRPGWVSTRQCWCPDRRPRHRPAAAGPGGLVGVGQQPAVDPGVPTDLRRHLRGLAHREAETDEAGRTPDGAGRSSPRSPSPMATEPPTTSATAAATAPAANSGCGACLAARGDQVGDRGRRRLHATATVARSWVSRSSMLMSGLLPCGSGGT